MFAHNPKDETVLEGKVTLVHIARGSVICKQGDVEKFLTFVVSGHLEVTQHDIHDNEEVCRINACQNFTFTFTFPKRLNLFAILVLIHLIIHNPRRSCTPQS